MKADKTTTYTKTETDTSLALKSNITYVDTAVSNLVGAAPTTLDTLKELALALGSDANFSTTVTTLIGTKSPLNNPTFTGIVSGINATMVGLSNVNNTSDLNKPISTAVQNALDLLNVNGSFTSSNYLGPSMQLSSSGHALYFNSTDCFSYSYDNGATGNSRIYSMLSGSPEGQYFSATSGNNVGSITIRPTYVSTTSQIIAAYNTTTAPLVIKTSSTNTILTVSQNGNTSIAGNLNTTGTIEVASQACIDNTGLVYAKSLYISMNPTILDTSNYFRVDKETGIKYQFYKYTQATNTTVTSIIRADIECAAMSYGNNNIIVDQNGVSCTPLTINCPALLSPLLIKNASSLLNSLLIILSLLFSPILNNSDPKNNFADLFMIRIRYVI